MRKLIAAGWLAACLTLFLAGNADAQFSGGSRLARRVVLGPLSTAIGDSTTGFSTVSVPCQGAIKVAFVITAQTTNLATRGWADSLGADSILASMDDSTFSAVKTAVLGTGALITRHVVATQGIGSLTPLSGAVKSTIVEVFPGTSGGLANRIVAFSCKTLRYKCIPINSTNTSGDLAYGSPNAGSAASTYRGKVFALKVEAIVYY